jgi:hypothetical protein
MRTSCCCIIVRQSQRAQEPGIFKHCNNNVALSARLKCNDPTTSWWEKRRRCDSLFLRAYPCPSTCRKSCKLDLTSHVMILSLEASEDSPTSPEAHCPATSVQDQAGPVSRPKNFPNGTRIHISRSIIHNFLPSLPFPSLPIHDPTHAGAPPRDCTTPRLERQRLAPVWKSLTSRFARLAFPVQPCHRERVHAMPCPVLALLSTDSRYECGMSFCSPRRIRLRSHARHTAFVLASGSVRQ